MQPAHYRGTRGGEKARKRLFYEDSDSVKNSQRHLFPRVPWRRVDWSEATAAVITAFQQIAAAPTDPTLPAWQIVAQFNAALLPHLPAPQVAAVAGAADGAPEEAPAGDGQPDQDAAAHDDQVDIQEEADQAAPPDQDAAAEAPELEVPERAPTEEEEIVLDHAQTLDDLNDTADEGQVQVGAEGQVQLGAAPEGAALGAPDGQGAEEEEQPVEDEYVEVEIDTPEGSIYSPLAPEEEEQELEEEASSSAFPAPTGRGPLSSRTPLVLRPASSVYPTVKIDSTGIWIRYSGPLSQPEPLTGAALSAPADDQEDPLYFEGDPYDLPEEAWTDPAAFARRHTAAGIPKSAETHDISAQDSPPKRSAAELPEESRDSKAARFGRPTVEEAAPDDSVPERLPKRARAEPKPVDPPRIVISKGDRPRAALVTPAAPLRIARAPPGKAPQVKAAQAEASNPDIGPAAAPAKAAAPSAAWQPLQPDPAQPFHRLRASSAVPPPPRAAPAIPTARRPRSSSPLGFEERGSDVGFGLAAPDEGEVDDPENTEPRAAADLIDPPPPQGLVRQAPTGAADGALGAHQPVTPPKTPPKRPPAPAVPWKAPPSTTVVPPRPGVVVYKPPPHGAFVAIIGKDPAGGRVRPPPSNLVHPNHRARRAREDWDRNNPQPAGAALGAPGPRPPPPPLYRAPQRQVAGRPKVVVIFDWFGVLSRSWDTRLRRFSNRFLLAFNRFLFELRPIEVGICSYADTNRERYLRDCLRPAREQIVNLQASPADFWLLQTTQRTGPEGKASFLHQVSTNYFVDDNPLICRECRRTGCVVVRADPSAGEQGLLDDLDNIQQNLEARDRDNLPTARQLAHAEFLFDPRAPLPRGQR